jgi:hypothetical protein
VGNPVPEASFRFSTLAEFCAGRGPEYSPPQIYSWWLTANIGGGSVQKSIDELPSRADRARTGQVERMPLAHPSDGRELP